MFIKTYSILALLTMLLLTSCNHKPIPLEVPGQPTPELPITKQIPEMTFAQALQAKKYYDHYQYEDLSMRAAQRMIATGGDQEELRKVTLELAEYFLKIGHYEKAQKHAADYQVLYPGTAQATHASYIAVKAHFNDLLSADRDQTKTHATLELAQNFIKKHEHATELDARTKDYVDQVKKMNDACYQKLVQSEVHIINSYLGKFAYMQKEAPLLSAQSRLAYVKEKLLPHAKNLEPDIISLEITLAQAANKPEVVSQKEQELTDKFPMHKLSLAQSLKKAWIF